MLKGQSVLGNNQWFHHLLSLASCLFGKACQDGEAHPHGVISGIAAMAKFSQRVGFRKINLATNRQT